MSATHRTGGSVRLGVVMLVGAVLAVTACADEGLEAEGRAGTEATRSEAEARPDNALATRPAEFPGRGTAGAEKAGQSLPADFPASIPLPERYELIASASGAAADINVTLHSPAALDDLKALYDDGLPEGGWDVTHRRESEFGDARTIHYGISRGEVSGIVQLIDDPERRLRVLGIALGER